MPHKFAEHPQQIHRRYAQTAEQHTHRVQAGGVVNDHLRQGKVAYIRVEAYVYYVFANLDIVSAQGGDIHAGEVFDRAVRQGALNNIGGIAVYHAGQAELADVPAPIQIRVYSAHGQIDPFAGILGIGVLPSGRRYGQLGQIQRHFALLFRRQREQPGIADSFHHEHDRDNKNR